MRFLPCGCEPAGVLRCDKHYDPTWEREAHREFMRSMAGHAEFARAMEQFRERLEMAPELPDEPGDEIVVVTPENCEHSCVAVCFGCRS